MKKQEERFEKVVGEEYLEKGVIAAALFIGLWIGICIFSMHLITLMPEWDTQFFPIGWMWIGGLVISIIGFFSGYRRKVYWRKIK